MDPPSLHIPDDLMFNDILTRLTAKSLLALTSVSKKWHRIITSNPNFAIHQSRNNSSSTSSKAFIFTHRLENCRIFSSLPLLAPNTDSRIGIPDPTLQFLPLKSDHFRLLASTNGLLCGRSSSFLHVFNPVTMKSDRIRSCNVGIDSVGLAFDPVASPHCYKLVHPSMKNLHENNFWVTNVEYSFEVFSSSSSLSCSAQDDQSWVWSSRKVVLPKARRASKTVFAKGVLYWHCVDYLLWFDCENDNAGYVSLPPQGLFVLPEIGVREGRVTCTQVTTKGLELWELVDNFADCDESWKMIYCVGLQKMFQESLTIRLSERPRKRKRCRVDAEEDEDKNSLILKRLWMCPFPFEGGEKCYLRVMLRPDGITPRTSQLNWEKLFSIDLKTGKMSEERFNGKLLLGYDEVVYGYDNNLVPLPKLLRDEH